MKRLKQLIRRIRILRYELELKRRFPDPFIVCDHAHECCAEDGYLCEPLTCDACTEPQGLYFDVPANASGEGREV